MIDQLAAVYAVGFLISVIVFYKMLLPYRKDHVTKPKTLFWAYMLAIMWFIFLPAAIYAYITEGEE